MAQIYSESIWLTLEPQIKVPWVMLSIHTEFHPIWSSRRDAVASSDLEIIDKIYCTHFIKANTLF